MGYSVITVRRTDGLPAGIEELAEAARTEGHGMVDVLVRDWEAGTNCFDRAGEALFGAFEGEALAGVGGLNIDPHSSPDEAAGRMRRLYVHPAFRRRGAATALVGAVATAASGRFAKLTVYAPTPEARAFYEACGFVPVIGRPRRSHELALV